MIGIINIKLDSNYNEIQSLEFNMKMIIPELQIPIYEQTNYNIQPQMLQPNYTYNIPEMTNTQRSLYGINIYFPLTVLLNNNVYNILSNNLSLDDKREFWLNEKYIKDIIFDTENKRDSKILTLQDAEILEIPKKNIEFILNEIFKSKTILTYNFEKFIINKFNIIDIDQSKNIYNVLINLNLIHRDESKSISQQVRISNCEDRKNNIINIYNYLRYNKASQIPQKRLATKKLTGGNRYKNIKNRKIPKKNTKKNTRKHTRKNTKKHLK